MNPASKSKLLIWSIVLLIAANIAVLTTIWILHHKETKQIQRGSPADFLIKELALDKKQEEQFAQLRQDHQQQSFKIKGDIKDARDNFFKLLQQPNVNDSEKKSASAEVAKNLQALELLTFDHFKKLRDICTPEQQKKFDAIIEDVMRMMANAPPGQRPPPNGNPQNGERPFPPNGEGPPNGERPPPPGDH